MGPIQDKSEFLAGNAVCLGVLVSFFGTLGLGFLLGFVTGYVGQGNPANLLEVKNELDMLFLICCFLGPLAGAYLAAKIAGFAHVRHGIAIFLLQMAYFAFHYVRLSWFVAGVKVKPDRLVILGMFTLGGALIGCLAAKSPAQVHPTIQDGG